MIEESLNFGMNATQLSQVSDLKSRVSGLDYSIQNVLDELNEIRDEQILVTKEQEEATFRQEKEYQIRNTILSLKNSIFSLKTEMEEIYQSNELSSAAKYINFRNVCDSPILEKLNPNYFDAFDDKEYTISVKKYLFLTRDKLFDSLSDDKKSILKVIKNKENELQDLMSQNIQRLQRPQEPVLDKSKIKYITKPNKPFGYISSVKREKIKDVLWPFIIIAFSIVVLLLFFNFVIIIIDLFSGNLSRDSGSNISMWIVVFSGGSGALAFMFADSLDNDKKIKEYDSEFSAYVRSEHSNKQLQKEYESKYQSYIKHREEKIENYQNSLKKYDDYQSNIAILQQELSHLYQSFTK